MHQQHLLQRQFDLTPRAGIILRKRRVHGFRPVDSQNLDGGVTLENQAREARGGEEVEEIHLRVMGGLAVAVGEELAIAFAAVPQTVEEECARFVDRFPAISEPV